MEFLNASAYEAAVTTVGLLLHMISANGKYADCGLVKLVAES
jgi:hypothetical protein